MVAGGSQGHWIYFYDVICSKKRTLNYIVFLCVNSQSVTFVHFFPVCHFNPFSPQSHRKSILIAIMFLQVLLCISISSFRYSNDSPELFQRKLGDLAFLVQNYELAYNSYHTAKRDFNNEHAWFYFAGALVSVLCASSLFQAFS